MLQPEAGTQLTCDGISLTFSQIFCTCLAWLERSCAGDFGYEAGDALGADGGVSSYLKQFLPCGD
jgi:hypothetical protein